MNCVPSHTQHTQAPSFRKGGQLIFFTLWNDSLLQAFDVFHASEGLYFIKNKVHTFCAFFILLEVRLYVMTGIVDTDTCCVENGY